MLDSQIPETDYLPTEKHFIEALRIYGDLLKRFVIIVLINIAFAIIFLFPLLAIFAFSFILVILLSVLWKAMGLHPEVTSIVQKSVSEVSKRIMEENNDKFHTRFFITIIRPVYEIIGLLGNTFGPIYDSRLHSRRLYTTTIVLLLLAVILSLLFGTVVSDVFKSIFSKFPEP